MESLNQYLQIIGLILTVVIPQKNANKLLPSSPTPPLFPPLQPLPNHFPFPYPCFYYIPDGYNAWRVDCIYIYSDARAERLSILEPRAPGVHL